MRPMEVNIRFYGVDMCSLGVNMYFVEVNIRPLAVNMCFCEVVMSWVYGE